MLVLAFLFFSLLVLSRVGVGLLILIVLRQLNKSPKTFFTWLWGDTARRTIRRERESYYVSFSFRDMQMGQGGMAHLLSHLETRKKPKRWGPWIGASHSLLVRSRVGCPIAQGVLSLSQRRWAAWERERPRHVNKFNSAEQQGPFWISHHIVLVMMIHRAAAILVGIFFFLLFWWPIVTGKVTPLQK